MTEDETKALCHKVAIELLDAADGDAATTFRCAAIVLTSVAIELEMDPNRVGELIARNMESTQAALAALEATN